MIDNSFELLEAVVEVQSVSDTCKSSVRPLSAFPHTVFRKFGLSESQARWFSRLAVCTSVVVAATTQTRENQEQKTSNLHWKVVAVFAACFTFVALRHSNTKE